MKIIIDFVVKGMWNKFYFMHKNWISATIRPVNMVERQTLTEYGQYVAECMPKYVQKVSVIRDFCYNNLFVKED